MEFPLRHPLYYRSSTKPQGYFGGKKTVPSMCGEGAKKNTVPEHCHSSVLKENWGYSST